MLALHIAYGFLPPPLRLTFGTHRSNFFVLSPSFLPLGMILIVHNNWLKFVSCELSITFITLVKSKISFFGQAELSFSFRYLVTY